MNPITQHQPAATNQQETEPQLRNNDLLFKDINAYCKGPFMVTFNAQSAPIRATASDAIILLFVLEGEVEINFKTRYSVIQAGHFLALSEADVRHSKTTPGTLLLHYNPPCRLAYYLSRCKRAFKYSCSSIVPINQEVQQWADNLITDITMDTTTLDELHMNQRRKYLSECLMRYPSSMLGELYVAFSACSRKCSEKCL